MTFHMKMVLQSIFVKSEIMTFLSSRMVGASEKYVSMVTGIVVYSVQRYE